MKSGIKKIVVSSIVISCAVFILGIYFFCYYLASTSLKRKEFIKNEKQENSNSKKEETTAEDNKEAMAEIEKQHKYMIIIEKDMINVYYVPENKLYLNTEIEVDSVEKSDIKQLKRGVYADTLKELYNYLETLTS